MKRNPDSNAAGPMKRMRGEEPILRLLIPSKVAGSIIGKGGKNISRLRTEYDASVSLPDCTGPERVVLVGTENIETAVKLLTDILPNIEDFFNRNQGKSEGDVRILVHQSLAGCVIGKAGSKVKELRDRTGAKIKIFGSVCPHSTDRVISIVGSVSVCADAVREILQLVKATPVKGFSEPYDPRNFDEEFSEEYGGFGVPRPWAVPPPGAQGGGGGGGGGLGGGALGGGGPRETRVTIPRDLAGAVIGKGGSRIRRIRQESGADVDIEEALPGAPDRIITIQGLPDQIQAAQYLLQQTVLQSTRGSNRF